MCITSTIINEGSDGRMAVNIKFLVDNTYRRKFPSCCAPTNQVKDVGPVREETAEAIHAGGAGAQCVARSITPRGQAKRRRKHFEDVHDRLQRKFSDLVDMMTAHAEEGDVERAPTEASNSSTSFDEIDWEFEEEMKRRHERLLQVQVRCRFWHLSLHSAGITYYAN